MAATKYRNGWPVLNPLAGDPSMRKGRTDADLLDFNRRIYAPGGMTPPSAIPTTQPNYPTGWQNLGGGRTQYGTNQTPYGSVGVTQAPSYRNAAGAPLGLPSNDPLSIANVDPIGPPSPIMGPPAPSTMGGFPVARATGPPDLNPGQDSYPVAPASPGSPMSPGMPSPLPGTPAGIGAAPAQNAMQQHQAEAATPPGMRPISNARRFFWATGRVDGSAPLAAASQPTNFDATFGPGATHMGGPGVTWQQRLRQNQQHIADASEQRGLDFSPY